MRTGWSTRLTKVCSTPGGTSTNVPAGATQLLVPEQERHLVVEHEEGVVLVLVHVQLRAAAAGGHRDDRQVEARRVLAQREELDIADAPAATGRDDDRASAWPGH